MAFFTYYVFGATQSNDALASLYKRAIPGSHLTESVDAVSLAFLASHHRNQALLDFARTRYLAALRLLNNALQDPELAVADATLQSVLLLDLYEKISNRSAYPSGQASWMSHVNGAMALVKLRGERNFLSHTARRLAMRLTVTVTVSCNASSSHVPETLVRLYKGLKPFSEASDTKSRIKGLVMNFTNFKADIRDGRFASDQSNLLSRAWDFDEQFTAMEETLSAFWVGKTVIEKTENPLAYRQRYDLYPDHLATQGANMLRTMRLLLHGLIQDHISASKPETANCAEALAASRKIIESLANAICASTPQFVLVGAKPENTLPFGPLQTLQCYSMLPHLYIAGQMSTDTYLRDWVINMTEYLAETGGMEVAKMTGEALRKKAEVPYWSLFAMLGSYAFAP
jgi:hypothetical protein